MRTRHNLRFEVLGYVNLAGNDWRREVCANFRETRRGKEELIKRLVDISCVMRSDASGLLRDTIGIIRMIR